MEWLSELIGFFIIVLLFIVPLLRKLLIDKKKVEQKREEEPPPIEVEPRFEATYERPMTERLVKKDFEFESEVAERELESQIEERELGTRVAPEFKERIVSEAFILETEGKRKKRDVIGEIVRGKSPERAMIVLSEVLGKPRGLE